MEQITAQQIHKDFYEAEDRLYVEAIGLKQSVLTSINDKSKRLQKLGFGKSHPVKDCEQKEAKRKIAGHIISVIEYFRTYYPSNKFITEDEVKKLCQKYGLLLGDTGNYIGDVPEKNLRDIETFKLRKEDWKEKEVSWYDMAMRNYPLSPEDVDLYENLIYQKPRQSRREQAQQQALNNDRLMAQYKALIMSQMQQPRPQVQKYFIGTDPYKEKKSETKKEYERPAFKICAPKEDFHTYGYEVRDGYRLVYDPIVLQPVSKEGIDGYLIVTAWGDEASDEMVVNQINN